MSKGLPGSVTNSNTRVALCSKASKLHAAASVADHSGPCSQAWQDCYKHMHARSTVILQLIFSVAKTTYIA